MKISIGSKIITGPWGGGNLFAQNLSEYLINKGHSVIYDLSESVGLKSIKNIKNNINIQYQHKGDNTINLQKFFGELNYAKISRLCDENMRKIGY